MGYDRGDSFPFDFEPKGIQFGSKSKGKLSTRSYPIQCERKWKHSFISEKESQHTVGVRRTTEERLVPLSIMGAQLIAHEYPRISRKYGTEGFKGSHHVARRHEPL